MSVPFLRMPYLEWSMGFRCGSNLGCIGPLGHFLGGSDLRSFNYSFLFSG